MITAKNNEIINKNLTIPDKNSEKIISKSEKTARKHTILDKKHILLANNLTIPDRKHTKLSGFHTMRNKNNTKIAAFLIPFAAPLTVLAQNNTVAVPNDKVPVVSPLASANTVQVTLSSKQTYTDRKGKKQTDVIVTQMKLQNPGQSCCIVTFTNNKFGFHKMMLISNGVKTTAYNMETGDSIQSTVRRNDNFFAHLARIPFVDPVHVLLGKEPCLLYTQLSASERTTGVTVLRLWIDNVTHLPVREEVAEITGTTTRSNTQTNCTDWKLNAPLDPALFIFTPPPGSKLVPDDNTTH